jgi:hypothetical protein
LRADTCKSLSTPAERAAFVEDADEVDDHVLAAEALAQLRLFVHIAVFQSQSGQHQQVLVLLPISRQHRDPMTVLDQSGDQTSPQEPGAAENGYGLRAHRISEFESIARWTRA